MNLFDFLTDRNRKTDYVQNMPPLQAIQIKDDGQGGALPVENPNVQPERKGLSLYERLFGVASNSTDYINNQQGTPITQKDEITGKDVIYNPQYDITTSENPRVGGIFNDIASGAKENFVTGFAAPNLLDNKIDGGNRDKGFAYRLGEGFGTLGRFAQSPLGRGLITAGIVGATGGNGLQALSYGGQAGLLNQQNRMKDELYRTHLNNEGIDTSNIRGYVGDDTLERLLKAKTLRDNAEFRKMYYDNQLKNQEAMQQFRQDQLEYNKQKDIQDRADKAEARALTRRGQDLNYDLGMARLNVNNKQNKENAKKAEAINNLNAVSNQLNRFEKTFEDVNNPYRYRLAGWASEKGNFLTPQEANFNSQRTLLFNKIARDLGGEKGVLSDQDIKRIEQSLPTLSDTKAQKKAKMTAIYNLLEDRKALYNNANVNNNPLGLDL